MDNGSDPVKFREERVIAANSCISSGDTLLTSFRK